MTPNTVLVSVVIPTVLRPALARAVASVANQNFEGDIEIIVVIDLERTPSSEKQLAALDLSVSRTLWTGGGRRASAARNIGVESATGEFVAFLDDDDEWLPNKLARQMEHARSIGGPVIISSRLVQVDPSTKHQSPPVPKRTIGKHDRVEDYLFRNRRPSITRASIYTSSLFVSAEIARTVLWDEKLVRHQDWDWLIRAQSQTQAQISHVADVQVRIWMHSTGSLSASDDWRASLGWIGSWMDRFDRRTASDFIAAQPLRYAILARSWRGFGGCWLAIVRCRRFPSLGPLVIAAAGLIPRRRLSRALLRRRVLGA